MQIPSEHGQQASGIEDSEVRPRNVKATHPNRIKTTFLGGDSGRGVYII
jgi:hypothetical protein